MTIELSPRTADSSPISPARPGAHTSELTYSLTAAAAILLFLLVGVWYSLATPPFETPDEPFHYGFARHLAAGNPLPVQNPEVAGPWEQEGSQAPLYYWLVGRLTAVIDQSDFPQLSVRNPRANIGDPLFPGNKNFMLYSAADRPLVGSNLALHIGRWFSLVLGALTLLFIYLTARLVLPHAPHLALIVLLIVATIPQFAFISASLSNDNLINASAAAVVYWLARMVWNTEYGIRNTELGIRDTKAWTAPVQPRSVRLVDWLVLGVLLGIAALSKLQGLGLVALSGLTVLAIAWQARDWRLPLRALLPVALPALAIAGWWYWRNYNLYDDWTGVSHLLANNGRRDDPLTPIGLWHEFRGLRYSFWGLFGWFNLLLPTWVYRVLDGITVLALAGLFWRLVADRITGRRKADDARSPHGSLLTAHALLLITWALLSLALLLYWTLQATGSQGRLLFPAIGALVMLLVLGLTAWVQWLPSRHQLIVWLALPALLLGSSLYTLLVLVPASYRAPQPVAGIPATALPLAIIYGDEEQIRLLGLEIPARRYLAGEAAPVTLYLQAPAPLRADYQLFIQFLDENRVEIGNLTSHPAWGRNPTTLWTAGAIYRDHYPVQISNLKDDWAPLLAQVYVGFVDPKTEKSGRLPVPAHDPAGEEIVPFVHEIAISPTKLPTVADLVENGAEFGNVIRLTGFQLGEPAAIATGQTFTVTLQWDALGVPATDYAAFVHLRDRAGQTVIGFDQEPAARRFPTRYWQAGDRIISKFPLTLPTGLVAGDYQLWVGLYEATSEGATRLPMTNDAGQQVGDGEVLLQEVKIR